MRVLVDVVVLHAVVSVFHPQDGVQPGPECKLHLHDRLHRRCRGLHFSHGSRRQYAGEGGACPAAKGTALF